MILLPAQWNDFYNGVKQDKHQTSEKRISIFVCGTDCDSLCALRVLQVQAILLTDQTPFSTFSTTSVTELKEAVKQEFGRAVRGSVRCVLHNIAFSLACGSLVISDGLAPALFIVNFVCEDYRTAFFINCGATTDVAELSSGIDAAARANIRFVVIDSHRPIHHSFNDDNDQDNILLHAPDWGDVPAEAVPLANSVAQEAERPRRRRRVDENSNQGNGEQDSERASTLHAYYAEGSRFGLPASVVLFELAYELHMGNNYLLWLAILGLTEQLLLRRVHEDTPHYRRSRDRLEAYVEEQKASEQQDFFGNGFDSDDEDDPTMGRATAPAPQGRIIRRQESKLVLMRHWPLLDALHHTPELLGLLRTFKEGGSGRQIVTHVLATLGIPLAQAQRSHSQTKMQFKTDEVLAGVHEELEAWLYKFNPHIDKRDRSGLRYASFVVEYGSQLALSAADHVHVLWAHLTDGGTVRSCSAQLAGFWNAYKALDVRDAQVPLGLERAKAQLRQLAQDASVTDPTAEQGSLITHGRGGPGYCLDLSAHRGFAATSPLVHPIALTRLALVLQDLAVHGHAHMPRTEWFRLPLVATGPPDECGECLMVALPGAKRYQKRLHPVEKTLMHSSFDGENNVYGGPEGLFATAVRESQVNSARADMHDPATLVLHEYDVAVLVGQLEEEFRVREQAVWAKQGTAAALLELGM